VLTLSHHHPFVAPPDVAPAERRQAERMIALADPRADQSDLDRLITLVYADAALRRWFEALTSRGLLDRSILVLAADHAIPDRPLWRHRPGARPAHTARTSIPLVLWISPSLLGGARDPDRARALALAAAVALEEEPISQNDVPTLLLALLERAPLVRALPTAARWHSMGGQATSPWFVPPGPPGSAIYGIHAATALYFVDRAGRATGPDEPATLVATPERARAVTPSLRPAAVTLGTLLGERHGCEP
jgi:hypothetical protein